MIFQELVSLYRLTSKISMKFRKWRRGEDWGSVLWLQCYSYRVELALQRWMDEPSQQWNVSLILETNQPQQTLKSL